MENTSASVSSNTTDSDFNDEICQFDNYMMLEDEYDEYLYNECALVEEKITAEFNFEYCVMLQDEYDQYLFEECALVEEKMNQQVGTLKRVNSSENADIAVKRARYEDGPSTSSMESSNTNKTSSNNGNEGDDKVNCSICQVLFSRRYLANHLKSIFHKSKLKKVHDSLKNDSEIESSFGNRIISYKIHGKNYQHSNNFEPELFLNSIKTEIMLLIEESIQQQTVSKVNFVLHANFIQQTKEDSFQTFDFLTYIYIFQGHDLNFLYLCLCDTLINKISSFEKKDNGWSLREIKALDMNVIKYNTLRGTSYTYIEVPKDIRTKKAVVNVKNADNLCFKWALLSALYPVNKNADRVSSYTANSYKLKLDGVDFPVKLSDISKAEKLNNISIHVFGLEFNRDKKCHSVVGPLYFTKSRKDVHVNLLLISNGINKHYCYIKNMSRLLSKQISNSDHAVHICDGCLLHFSTKERLINHQQHDCAHIARELPNKLFG